jgi:hypothetical protein
MLIRLDRWIRKAKTKAQETWWFWPIVFAIKLAEDRFYGNINSAIDERGWNVLQTILTVLMYPYGFAFNLLVLSILALLIHAYVTSLRDLNQTSADNKKKDSSRNPLRIEFRASSYELTEEVVRSSGLGLETSTNRKTYWFHVYNSSSTNISNVGAEITRLVKMESGEKENILGLMANKFPPYRLRFKISSEAVIDLPPGRRERVDFVSERHPFGDERPHFVIEGEDKVGVSNPYDVYKAELTVTAANVLPVRQNFFIQLKPDTLELTVEPENWSEYIVESVKADAVSN